MEARIYRISINKMFFFPKNEHNYKFFIEKNMQLDLLKVTEEYFLVDIDDDKLQPQTFKDKTWYRSLDKKYALFEIVEADEVYWKVLFQRGR